MKVKKFGITGTERLLAELCDKTFLRLWSYANPFRKPGTELCDVIAILDNDIFLFFDREVRSFEHSDNIELAWRRWHRKVITAQITTAKGARRHIITGGDIFFDAECKIALRLPDDRSNLRIHLIVVAHGAKEACIKFSGKNVYGSLAIKYEDSDSDPIFPFLIPIEKNDPVHVFDSQNLEIILGELDTIADFSDYLKEKERAVKQYKALAYAGEEDLLAHYLQNFQSKSNKYYIGTQDGKYNVFIIQEGIWADFVKSQQYRSQKEANRKSYIWDDLIQRNSQYMLEGTAIGNTNILGPSAVREMAKERRLARRALANEIIEAIQKFAYIKLDQGQIQRKMTYFSGLDSDIGYIFLQVRAVEIADYAIYRKFRQEMLKVACGSAKNRFPKLQKVIGIAIDAPRFVQSNSEDLILLECDNWSDHDRIAYERGNEMFGFFRTTGPLASQRFIDFPPRSDELGRN
ncbi:hypothetical protein ACOSOMT5_P0104 [Acidiphilium sp. MT5]